MDNKAPKFNVDVYYKTATMEQNAERLTELDDDNYKLVKRINIIYRTRVKTIVFRIITNVKFYIIPIIIIIMYYNKCIKVFSNII